MRIIKFIVVHCTATSPKAKLKDIQYYWKFKLGWRTGGYHYVIDHEGTPHQLEKIGFNTNGVAGFNSYAVHVAYIGGLDAHRKPADTRTPEQKVSLFKLLTELKKECPDALIVGHRDLSPDLDHDGVIEPKEWKKVCPCFDAMTDYVCLNVPKPLSCPLACSPSDFHLEGKCGANGCVEQHRLNERLVEVKKSIGKI